MGRPERNGIYFGSLDSKDTHLVVATNSAAQYAPGYLLYQAQTALVAQPFNPVKGTLAGEATPLVGTVRFDAGVWRGVFSVSQNGLLTYEALASNSQGTQLAWFDRNGKMLENVGQRQIMLSTRLSPDGARVAFMGGKPGSSWDIWT